MIVNAATSKTEIKHTKQTKLCGNRNVSFEVAAIQRTALSVGIEGEMHSICL